MATILKGKKRGEKVKLCQWSNDWISVDPHGIFKPTFLSYTKEEKRLIERTKYTDHIGIFFQLFQFIQHAENDYRLERIKP